MASANTTASRSGSRTWRSTTLSRRAFLPWEYYFTPAGAGAVHTITIAGTPYSYTEVDAIGSDGQPVGNSGADVVRNLILAIGANQYVVAAEGSATNAVLLTVQLAKAGVTFPVSASDGNNSVTMLLTTAAMVAAQIVSEINSTNWIAANTTHGLLASNSGAAIALMAARYGTVKVSGTTAGTTTGNHGHPDIGRARFPALQPVPGFCWEEQVTPSLRCNLPPF